MRGTILFLEILRNVVAYSTPAHRYPSMRGQLFTSCISSPQCARLFYSKQFYGMLLPTTHPRIDTPLCAANYLLRASAHRNARDYSILSNSMECCGQQHTRASAHRNARDDYSILSNSMECCGLQHTRASIPLYARPIIMSIYSTHQLTAMRGTTILF